MERPCRSARFAWPPSQRPTIVVIEVERALYDLSLLNNELDIIEQEIDADNLADEMHTRLYAMQLDLCQRLAFFCDSVAGFGRCPPDTLAAMISTPSSMASMLKCSPRWSRTWSDFRAGCAASQQVGSSWGRPYVP